MVHLITDRRIGRFSVTAEVINNNPEVIQAALAAGIVLDVKFDPVSETFEYTSISAEFDEIEDGDPVPIYSVLVTETNDSYNIEWSRQDGGKEGIRP